MRVVEVVQGLGMGGAERALVSRLTRAPNWYEATILNLRPSLDRLSVPRDIPLINLDVQGSRIVKSLQSQFALDRPDLIVLRTPRDAILFTSRFRRALRGIPILYEAHSSQVTAQRLLSPALALALQRANARIDLHLAVSESVASSQHCSGAREVHVHYLGVDVNRTAKPLVHERNGSGVRFLVLGRLHPTKRPIWIAQAIQDVAGELRQAQAEVLFVGDGPERKRLEKFVRKHSLGDIIRVWGHLDDPSSALASSDVLIQGSRMEGLPLSILEAKRMGLRVVCTPAGGSAEPLGPEDCVTSSFERAEFAEAITSQLVRGRQTDEFRLTVQERYEHLNADLSARQFYGIVHDRFSRKRVTEFLAGPIEGGIPTTIRSRLSTGASLPETQLMVPRASTSELLAPLSSFGCTTISYPGGLGGINAMRRQLATFFPQLILAHGERELAYAFLIRLLAKSNSRLVLIIHNETMEARWWMRPISRTVTRLVGRSVNAVMAVSSSAQSGEIAELFKDVSVVLQPLKLQVAIPTSETDGLRFISAGRCIPAKAFDRLILAVSNNEEMMRNRQGHLLIAGDGPELLHLQAMVNDLSLEDLVTLPGHVDALHNEMLKSHYFLQPSLSEGAGMALLEALWCGSRVASGPVGFARELLKSDPLSTLFPTSPSVALWSDWLGTALQTEKPTLAERVERANSFRSRYQADVLTETFYEKVLGAIP